jgi:hypothetical protein
VVLDFFLALMSRELGALVFTQEFAVVGLDVVLGPAVV